MLSKKCKICEEILPLTGYHNSKISKDGFNARCVECERKHNRNQYKRHKSRILATRKRRYASLDSKQRTDLKIRKNKEYVKATPSVVRRTKAAKRCSVCFTEKGSQDYTHKNFIDLLGMCRSCYTVWYEGNREQIRIRRKLKNLVKHANKRARMNNIPFDLDPLQLNIPAVCPILGIPLIFTDKITTHNTPSLDRLVPRLGYVPGNVHIISWKANAIKSYGTAEDHEKIAAWMRNKSLTNSGS